MDQIKKRWNFQMRYLHLKLLECSACTHILVATIKPSTQKRIEIIQTLRLTASNSNYVELFFYFHFQIIFKCTSEYFA